MTVKGLTGWIHHDPLVQSEGSICSESQASESEPFGLVSVCDVSA